MALTFKTPGVYVVEQSLLPPSVAEVATAVPAFIGYTPKHASLAKQASDSADVRVRQITSMVEYEQLFGAPTPATFEVNVKTGTGGVPEQLDVTTTAPSFILGHALRHYFENGGGRCYVVSVGATTQKGAPATPATLDKDLLLKGIAELEKYDEPTLVVIPEAAGLTKDDHASVCGQAMAHCAKMGDRFAILDVRVDVGSGVDDENTTSTSQINADSSYFRDTVAASAYGAAYYPSLRTTLTQTYEEASVKVTINGKDDPKLHLAQLNKAGEKSDPNKEYNAVRYNAIKRALAEQRVVLPPSAAMAGVYCRVDGTRGVWKAPANVNLMSVIEPTVTITSEQQEALNIHESGKSINAIRAFSGRGILVWGARTLMGQDNEWRYVPVRRLFITVEESAKKATQFAVFEPNDANTWLKVKGMLESYLYGLWEKGALQGSKPEQAYFVKVGLGVTMTSQDILEGRMIVQIGLAAVRPAEFIVLTFSHKLPEA